MASPDAYSAPAQPKTARRVESTGSPLAVGLGRQPQRWDVSTDDLGLWIAPAGGDPSPGLGHCPPPHAGLCPTGQRAARPLGAPGHTNPGAVAGLLAARAAPTLAVPRSRPADASPGDHPAEDLQARGAAEWPRQRCLHPHAPALL